MVNFMPFMARVDGQGRMVLPKEAGRALGVEGGSKLVCRVVGNRVILERYVADRVREAFSKLEEATPSLDLDVGEVEGGDKYIDVKYALRKIGFGSNG